MLIEALANQAGRLRDLLPELREALERLDDSGNLSLPQALLLAAATLEARPQVVVDLGTGGGNSATAFGLAGHEFGTKVYTFDLYPSWENALKPRLAPMLQTRLDGVVTPVVGDICGHDLAPLIGAADSVVVFWDAHGYAIAERVLGHLMPLIADRRHVVICHDMTDSRFLTPGPYDGKGFWRGTDGAHENPTYPHTTIGTLCTRVEQAIPILDFCWRNGIEFHSLDWQLHGMPEVAVGAETLPILGVPQAMLHMRYFSLNETSRRFFPALLQRETSAPTATRVAGGIRDCDVSDAKGDASGLYRVPEDGAAAGRGDGTVMVVTPAEQWAYALEMPPQLPDATASQRFQVALGVRVLSGRVGAGVAVRNGSRFHHYEMTSPDEAEAWQVLEVGTPPADDCGSLIINNASPNGASSAELRILGITNISPPGKPAAPRALREVHVIEDVIGGNLQNLYLDKTAKWLRPNLTFVRRDGTIYFETNEAGLKGDPIDPNRRQAVVWGDSVVFGQGRGWPCLLDEMLPGYQFLNGGIEGDAYESVLQRAVTLNRELDIALNIIMLGWHRHGRNETVRADLIAALDHINNPILMTMPTALNERIVKNDLSNYLKTHEDSDIGFHFCGSAEYSIEMQQEIFRHITERNHIIREVAAEKGVPLLDLFATLATEQLADFRQDFFDVMHPRPNTYEKIARTVCEGLGIIPGT